MQGKKSVTKMETQNQNRGHPAECYNNAQLAIVITR